MQRTEQEKRVELPQKELPRSANYVARLVDLSPESLDISKPFTTSSEKLAITPDAYKVLDKVSSVDSSLYWLAQEKDGKLDYDAQMRVFTESWAQAIRSKYEIFEGEREAMDEMQKRRLAGNLGVLDKLGLSVSDLDAQGIREFYDRYFANGRNTQQFISDIKNSFSKDQIRENIDTFQFVAEMFDTETAQDIAGILLLEAEDDKKGFVEKVNKQARVTNKKEQQRLTKLARNRYPIKAGELADSDRIIIGDDKQEVKILTAEDEIKAMQGRIDSRGAGESDRPDIKFEAPQVKFGNEREIRIGESTEEGLMIKEFPGEDEVYLRGKEGDGLRILLDPFLLATINENIVSRSVDEEGEHKREQAGFLLGRRYKDPKTGVLWTEVTDFVEALGLHSTSGSVTFTPESFRMISDLLINSKGLLGDNVSLVGYAHSHPSFYMGKMSEDDKALNEIFSLPGQFAYVVGPSSRNNFAYIMGAAGPFGVKVTEGPDLDSLHAFFSARGSGDPQPGEYKKHVGIYFKDRSDQDSDHKLKTFNEAEELGIKIRKIQLSRD